MSPLVDLVVAGGLSMVVDCHCWVGRKMMQQVSFGDRVVVEVFDREVEGDIVETYDQATKARARSNDYSGIAHASGFR